MTQGKTSDGKTGAKKSHDTIPLSKIKRSAEYGISLSKINPLTSIDPLLKRISNFDIVHTVRSGHLVNKVVP